MATLRPSSDDTTAGWTAFPTSPAWDTVDDTTADDTDYVISPDISSGGISTPLILGFTPTITVAGTYEVTIRAKALATSNRVRVTLLNASNVAVSTPTWISLTSLNYVDYKLSVATTGPASKIKIEAENVIVDTGPTTATLSGPTSAGTGISTQYTVTLDVAAEEVYTVSWLKDGVSVSSTTIAVGSKTTSTYIVWDTAGPSSVSFTINPSETIVGAPINVNVWAPAAVGDFEPQITGEPQPDAEVRYSTYDGGEGPTWKNWNTQLGFTWKNPHSGDWTDKNGIPQGPTPFFNFGFGAGGFTYKSTSDPGLVELVNKSKGTANYGWTCRITNGWANGHGRLGENPPLLSVTTASGTYSCPCTTFAIYMSQGTSELPYDSRSIIPMSNGTCVLRFDLRSVVGVATQATLQIYVTEASGGPYANMAFFELAPPVEMMVGCGTLTPSLGLAAEVGENALPTHPDVYMAGDFEGTVYNTQTQSATSPKLFPSIGCSIHNAPEILPDEQAPGTWYWRGSFAPMAAQSETGERQAFDGTKRLMECDTSNELNPVKPPVIEELYYRMYVMLEPDFISRDDGNKMAITFDARMGFFTESNYWSPVSGNGGVRGEGIKAMGMTYEGVNKYIYDGSMERMECTLPGAEDNPTAKYRTFTGYNYHMDQGGSQGSSFPPGVAYNKLAPVVFENGRWYCVEQHMKMNTIDLSNPDEMGNGEANYDGLIETWVNGILVDRITDYRWRRHPEMGIAQVNSNWYYGGRNKLDARMHWRINHLVVAKRYIGPRIKPDSTGPLPGWRTSMQPGEWKAIGNALQTVDPAKDPALNPNYPDVPPWSGTGGSGGIERVVAAWNSGVLMSQTNRLELKTCGGHGDYAGNECYGIDLSDEDPVWILDRPPTGCIGNLGILDDGMDNTSVYFDGRPRSNHTYNNQIEVNGEFFMIMGAPFRGGSMSSPPHGFFYRGGDWVKTPAIWPVGNGANYGSAILDEQRQRVYYAISANGTLWYASLPNLDTLVNTNCWMNFGGQNHSIRIPERDIILVLSNFYSKNVGVYDYGRTPNGGNINTPGATGTSPPAIYDVGSGGGGLYHNGVWVPELGSVLCWHGGNSLWRLTPPAAGTEATAPWAWTMFEPAGSNTVNAPALPSDRGMYGRWFIAPKLRVLGLLNDHASPVYVFAY